MPDTAELRSALINILRQLGGPVADGVEQNEASALLSALTSLLEARELVDALHQIEAAH